MQAEMTTAELFHEIKAIRQDVQFIKSHMFDPDTIMTIDEERRFKQSFQELQEGKTTPLSALKKELGL